MYRKIWLGLVALILVGCGLLGEGDLAVEPTVTAEIPTPANTPVISSSVLSAPAPLLGVEGGETDVLTLWTMAQFSPSNELPGGAPLLEQLSAFNDSHPDLSLYVELKTVADQGGMLSYLRTGRNVAPSILPDLILLPTGQIPAAVSDGLIFPLNGLVAEGQLDEAMFDDLYPAGRELVTIGENVYGYPIAFENIYHFAYNSNVVTQTLGATWGDLGGDSVANLIFPAGGAAGGQLALQLYMEAGGTFVNVAGESALEQTALVTALTVLSEGVEAGFVWPASVDVGSLEESWQIFQNSPSSLVQTSAEQFLRQRGLGFTVDFVPLPGREAPLPPHVTGWAWAISTPDPARQALAAELISWLGLPQNVGEWSVQALRPPARRGAMNSWAVEDAYTVFLHEQLLMAEAFPAGATSQIVDVFNQAVVAVVAQTSTPQEAADAAVAAVGE